MLANFFGVEFYLKYKRSVVRTLFLRAETIISDDKDKEIELKHLKSVLQAPVVQTSDSAIHRINHYPPDSVIDFRNTYPLDSDLASG